MLGCTTHHIKCQACVTTRSAFPGLSSLPEALQHYATLEQRSFDLFTACNEASERLAAMGREAKELEAEVRQMEVRAGGGRERFVEAKANSSARRMAGSPPVRGWCLAGVGMVRRENVRRVRQTDEGENWEASVGRGTCPECSRLRCGRDGGCVPYVTRQRTPVGPW